MQGWIKLFRMILDNPIVTKDSDYFAVWIYLLLLATHQEKDVLFKGKRITLKKGQLITGRKEIAKKFKIDESKVQRILKSFENEHQIEQQSGNKNRLVAIVSWEDYQQIEQQNEQQVNNNCTTDEQQVNTNKNVKNIKNDKNVKNSVVISEEITCQTESVRPSIQLIVDAWNSLQKDTAIKPVSRIATSSTRYKLLSARLKEYGIDNVLNAIENIRQSDFLKGNNDRGWIITFDWFVKPNNFPKVLEGNYCNTVGTVCNQTKRKSEYDEFMADLATIREECIRNGE